MSGQWYEAKVAAITPANPSYLHLTLKVPEEFQNKAGQFTAVKVRDSQGEFNSYYSIANAPNKKSEIELCMIANQNPRLSAFLSQLQPGDRLEIMAPATGKFDASLITGDSIFIAGGSGIAPLRALIQSQVLSGSKHKILLIYGCKVSEEIPYREDFLELQSLVPQFRVHFCADVSSSSDIAQGQVDRLLEGEINPQAQYFLCGPPGMVNNIKGILCSNGIATEQIFFEGY